MRVFTCNTFVGYWPVGSAAVVVAEDRKAALGLLREALDGLCLLRENEHLGVEDLVELTLGVAGVQILADGNY